ncbi:hypothetical protein GCM10009785_18190 [Brooklawnia cerclae]|uniref:Uncharacterized protein n=1 Tax=Brooklawnia cerclae TaxID=349934 RepID=A0ABX0SGZ3_9ACTN|nr:hypothetical protein [Brooklawnia cerclae]NIH57609.1 hypothetical protein [Brooklawnia cerclae]
MSDGALPSGWMEQIRSCALLDDLSPVNGIVLRSGSRLELAVGSIAGRPTLVGALDGTEADAGDIWEVARRAEAMSMPSVTVTTARPTGVAIGQAGPPRSPHVVVAPPAPDDTEAAFGACRALRVTLTDRPDGSAVLSAPDTAAGLDLACLLVSCLPATCDQTPPSYRPVDKPEAGELGPAAERNATAVLFAVCDDMLRLFPDETDELVLAAAHVHGHGIAMIAPQSLSRPTLTQRSVARLTGLLRLCARYSLPVAVLGGLPEMVCEPAVARFLLRDLAVAAADLHRPVILVPDDTPGSSVQRVLGSAPAAVELASSTGLRRGIAGWIGADLS